MTGGKRRDGLLVWVTLAVSLAPASAQLLPVPEPSLDGMDGAVRRQLTEARAELDVLAGRPGADAARLAESYGDLGRLYLAYDLPAPAEACLANARRLEPENVLWPYLLGVLYQKDRRVDDALASFEAALALDPDDLAILIRLGQVQLERAEPAKAKARFAEALTRAADAGGAAAVRAGLGKALAAEGDAAGAVRELEAALAVEPGASSLRYPLALAYRELGRLDDARRHLAERGPEEPSFPDPRYDEVRGLATGAGVHLLAGNRALGRGDVAQALAEYELAVAADPRSVPAREALATTLAGQGDAEGAILHYTAALEVEPDNFLVRHNLGTVLARSGRPEDAVEHFRRALVLVPEEPAVLYKLARNLARTGRLDEAQRRYRELIALQPEDGAGAERGNDLYAAARFELSEILFGTGRYREAAALLRELVAEDPSRSWAHLSLGVALQASGNEPGAMAEYRAVLEAGTARPEERIQAQIGLGRLLARRQDHGGAKESFRAALGLDPGHPGAHRGLAEMSAREGSYDEAASHYREVVERLPGDEDARLGLAYVLLLAERDAAARRGLEEALRALPDSARLRHLMARVLAASDDGEVRDGDRALALALALYENERRPEHAETVAMALAELGRFDEAVEWQKRSIGEAESSGEGRRVPALRRRLELYEKGEPCRAPWSEP